MEVLVQRLIVIAFACGVGGALALYGLRRHHEQVDARAAREIAMKARDEFVRLVYARLTASAVLNSAIERKAPRDELVQKKRDHDLAFAQWNIGMPALLLGLRRTASAPDYARFEGLVESQLRRPFYLVTSCLTDAYDASIGVQPKRGLECDIEGLLQVARECSDAMTASLPGEAEVRGQEAVVDVPRRCDVSKLRVAGLQASPSAT